VAKTVSGDLEVEALDGSASVTSVSGDVVFRSLIKGEAQIRSVSGDVEVGVASGTQVFLDLAARAGEAHSNLDMVEAPVSEDQLLELKVHTVSGDIRVRRAPARIDVTPGSKVTVAAWATGLASTAMTPGRRPSVRSTTDFSLAKLRPPTWSTAVSPLSG
jgi:hypothetical protein